MSTAKQINDIVDVFGNIIYWTQCLCVEYCDNIFLNRACPIAMWPFSKSTKTSLHRARFAVIVPRMFVTVVNTGNMVDKFDSLITPRTSELFQHHESNWDFRCDHERLGISNNVAVWECERAMPSEFTNSITVKAVKKLFMKCFVLSFVPCHLAKCLCCIYNLRSYWSHNSITFLIFLRMYSNWQFCILVPSDVINDCTIQRHFI